MTECREIVIKIPEDIISFVNCHGFLPENYRSAMGRVLLDGVELPKEHGDLIDKDKLICKLKNSYLDTFGMKRVMSILSESPTIIEADKGE